MLVSGSIHSACRFFEMLQQTDLADKCAIVTSYKPAPADIKGEETRRGAYREAATVRHLPKDAFGALQRARRHRDEQG